MALMCRHFYAFTTYVHILIHRQNHIEMYVYPKCVGHTQTHLFIYTRVCGVPSVCTNFNIQASFFIYIQSNACFHRFNIHIINNFILCKFCKNFTSCTFSYLHHLFLKFIQHFKDSLIRNL